MTGFEVIPDSQIQRWIDTGLNTYTETLLNNPQNEQIPRQPDGPIGAAGASPNAADSVARIDPNIFVYDHPGRKQRFPNDLSFSRSTISFTTYVYDKNDDLRPPSWIKYVFNYRYDAPNAPMMSVDEIDRYIAPCS